MKNLAREEYTLEQPEAALRASKIAWAALAAGLIVRGLSQASGKKRTAGEEIVSA